MIKPGAGTTWETKRHEKKRARRSEKRHHKFEHNKMKNKKGEMIQETRQLDLPQAQKETKSKMAKLRKQS